MLAGHSEFTLIKSKPLESLPQNVSKGRRQHGEGGEALMTAHSNFQAHQDVSPLAMVPRAGHYHSLVV